MMNQLNPIDSVPASHFRSTAIMRLKGAIAALEQAGTFPADAELAAKHAAHALDEIEALSESLNFTYYISNQE